MLLMVLLIGLKGFYILNVYSSLFLGFLQTVIYYNECADANYRF